MDFNNVINDNIFFVLFCVTWIYKGYIVKFELSLLSITTHFEKKSCALVLTIDFLLLFLFLTPKKKKKKKKIKLSSSNLLYSQRGYTLQFMPVIKSLELDLINN